MPSERGFKSRLWALLVSQGLGVTCGLATVFLLAVGSVALVASREGASAGIQGDDIRPFFEQPSLWHTWFYLLVVVLAVYGLNVFLCTCRTVWLRVKAGVTAPSAYGAALMHTGFLFALLAHLVGGWGGSEGAPIALTDNWVPLTETVEARLEGVTPVTHPDGSTKQIYADIQWRRGEQGVVHDATISYNGPLTENWGSRLFLLAGVRKNLVARISDGQETCTAAAGRPCRLGERLLFIAGIHLSGHWGNRPMAVVRSAFPQSKASFFLIAGRKEERPDGTKLELVGLEEAPVVIVRHRYAPGNPWALLASVVLVVGMILFGRSWWTVAQR